MVFFSFRHARMSLRRLPVPLLLVALSTFSVHVGPEMLADSAIASSPSMALVGVGRQHGTPRRKTVPPSGCVIVYQQLWLILTSHHES
ncbi:hypothetical protein GGR52DRAFT_165446 [Hypoxylon sp. FL1284]|nr:hypothetical protein GGR52DRAFT_165446 [Hypoxylon sp. FL1284]